MQRLKAVLPTDAAHLETAIRQRPVNRTEGVDGDRARLESGRHAMGPRHIIRPYTCKQSVIDVVRQLDYFVLRVERDHSKHGTEDLVLSQIGPVVDVGEDGRLNVVAAREALRPTAASNQAGAGAVCRLDHAQRLGELFGGCLRADMSRRLERSPDSYLPRSLGQAVQERLVDLALEKEAGSDRAGLPGRSERTVCSHGQGPVEARVSENDVG